MQGDSTILPNILLQKKIRIASTEGSVVLAEGIPHVARPETTQPKGFLVANYTIKDQILFGRDTIRGNHGCTICQ